MEMVKDINNLAEIFYNRFLDDMELNGTYDENDPANKLAEEISETLEIKLGVKETNALEEKIFTLSDMYNKEHFIEGFKAGASAACAILNVRTATDIEKCI